MSRHVFKVFRFTTRFKKYRLGYTSFYRKKYSNRKRRSNWLFQLHIITRWVNLFLKQRQVTRFIQYCGIFKLTLILPSINLLFKSLDETSSITSLAVTSIKKTLYTSLNVRYNQFYPPSNGVTEWMFTDPKTLDEPHVLTGGLLKLNRTYTPTSSLVYCTTSSLYTRSTGWLSLTFQLYLTYLISLYKLTIYLSLYVINKK